MFYKLDENNNVIPCSCKEWGEIIEERGCPLIASDQVGETRISTVFLGLDHNYFGGRPILFETMVFDNGNHDIYMDRYSTWDEAILGHEKAIQWVKDGCNESTQ